MMSGRVGRCVRMQLYDDECTKEKNAPVRLGDCLAPPVELLLELLHGLLALRRA